MVGIVNLKDRIVEETAKELELPEALCERVVNWAYKDAKEARHIYTEIELSGFGKLIVSQSKLRRRLSKFENIRKGAQSKLTENGTQNWEKRLKGAEEALEFLNTKVK